MLNAIQAVEKSAEFNLWKFVDDVCFFKFVFRKKWLAFSLPSVTNVTITESRFGCRKLVTALLFGCFEMRSNFQCPRPRTRVFPRTLVSPVPGGRLSPRR